MPDFAPPKTSKLSTDIPALIESLTENRAEQVFSNPKKVWREQTPPVKELNYI